MKLESRLKWYEKRWFFFLLIFLSIGSLISLFDEGDISYLSMFLFFTLAIPFVYKLRKEGLKRAKIDEERFIQNNTIPVFKHNKPMKSNEVSKREESLKYSKVRKLIPDFTVLDFETTGLSAENDKIIQVAAVKYQDFEKTDEYVTYVNPKIAIPTYITEINGISNKDVKDAPTITEMLPKLLEFLGDDLLVAHNASFDMKFLLTNMYTIGYEYKKYRVVDTLSLARKHIDFTKNHKLETLKSFLKLNHLSSHDALHDCYVTAELYKYCYNENMRVSEAK